MEELTVRIVNLPESIGGCVSDDADGHHNVYINAKWGINGQMLALQHELKHIENEDLYNEIPIEKVEAS